MRKILPGALLPAVLLCAGSASAIVPPKDGGALPDKVIALKRQRPDAYMLRRAWVSQDRARVGAAALGIAPDLSTDGRSPLAGTLRIPVLVGLYSDIEAPTISLDDLQTQLFDGPWHPGTLNQYFLEVSGGLFSVAGEVHGWIQLENPESYYTGGVPFWGLVPGYSRTDEMIAELVAALDGQIDFGQFDNDGPDGIPNSGDDDGFVDVLVVVHSMPGAECARGPHMWSHSWLYSLWREGGEPLRTSSPAAGGGVIKIDEYIVAPAVSCSGGMIEIGVFCHELGHAIGLSDLYDYTGRSSGIGHWGLMGSGNWNRPVSPAHPCAWSKEQLGWVTVVDVGWEALDLALGPVARTRNVARLVLPTRRFRRALPPASPTGWALVCGYTAEAAAARGWPGGAGYGNMWNESISRTFHFDGSLPVTLEFDIETDLESGYDFAYALMQAGAAAPVETLAALTGRRGLTRMTIDLGSRLPPGATDIGYKLSYALVSDFNFSDEDGRYNSAPGSALLIDNVRVSGGGVEYFEDFTHDAGGWRETSPPAEYFLVEHRTRSGFDAYLHGEGLLIWHAESSTARSVLGNSGGSTGLQARGLVLEEADGRYDLLKSPGAGGNQGDAGDPWPGSTGNRAFTTTSSPSSRDNSGRETPASVTGISSGRAVYKAGLFPPLIVSIEPDSIDAFAGGAFEMTVSGDNFAYGAGCFLSRGGSASQPAAVEWLGENRIRALFDAASLYRGAWDLTLVGGDGQRAVAAQALQVDSRILLADVQTGRSFLRPVWIAAAGPDLRGSLLYRSENGGPFTALVGDTLRDAAGNFIYTDETVVPGVVYRYRAAVFYDDAAGELLFPGAYTIEDLPFQVFAAAPNPFGGETKIGFFVPGNRRVSVSVYDVAGRRIAVLADAVYQRGEHEIVWAPDPGRAASGVYFCVFSSGRVRKTVKLVLIR